MKRKEPPPSTVVYDLISQFVEPAHIKRWILSSRYIPQLDPYIYESIDQPADIEPAEQLQL